MIKVLLIGETCIDKFVYCEVTRFSPEAPIPVLKPLYVVENLGMSGNVKKNIESLNKNVDVYHIHQSEVITKTRFVESKSNHMFIRLDEGEYDIQQFKIDSFTEDFIKNFDITIVSDYNKGFLSDDDIIYIAKNSKLSILDSKRKLNESILESFSFVKLNEIEMINNKNFSNHKNIIVTLGSKGAKFNDEVYPSINPKETVDVSGAGDTFTSSFILKFYETKNISESIRFANEMSSIVVSKKGVTTPF